MTSRALWLLLFALPVMACPAPRPTVEIAPWPAPDPPLGAGAKKLEVVAESELHFELFPVDDALFVGFDVGDVTWRFAVVEPSGLRPVPEMSFDIKQGPQRFEGLVGRWPGSLWRRVLEVDTTTRPGDTLWATLFHRLGPKGWTRVDGIRPGDQSLVAWSPSPGCLVGIYDHGMLASARRRAIDCAGREVPRGRLGDDPKGAHTIRAGGASQAGDVFLLEEATGNAASMYRVEVQPARDVSAPSAHALPLPAGVDARALTVREGSAKFHVRGPDDAYLGLEIEPAGSARKATFHLYHFDGRAWSKLDLPPHDVDPLFTVAADGTVVLATSSSPGGAGPELWFKRPARVWEKGAFLADISVSCNFYGLFARSLDDIWVTCGTPKPKPRSRVLHTGLAGRVWRPGSVSAGSPVGGPVSAGSPVGGSVSAGSPVGGPNGEP